jgi:hypothetical protein
MIIKTDYFSSDFLGLPRFRIVDSNPNVAVVYKISGQRDS